MELLVVFVWLFLGACGLIIVELWEEDKIYPRMSDLQKWKLYRIMSFVFPFWVVFYVLLKTLRFILYKQFNLWK